MHPERVALVGVLFGVVVAACGSCEDAGSVQDAEAAGSARVGVVLEAEGDVRVRRPGVERWRRATDGDALHPGDAVQTMAGARALLRFPGVGGTTELGPGVVVVVPGAGPDGARVRHTWGHLVARLEPGQGGQLALDLPPGELLLERDDGSDRTAEARVAVAEQRTEVAVTKGRGTLRRRGGAGPQVMTRGTYGVFDDEGTVLELGADGPRPTPRKPADGARVRTAASVSFLWTAVDEATTYRLEVWPPDAEAPAVVETPEVEASLPLEEGPHRWRVRAVFGDREGRPSAPRPFEVEVDRVAPALDVRSPGEGQAVLTRDVTIVGRTEPGAHLEVDGSAVPVGADGRFEWTRPLRRGRTHLVIRATDDVGNARTVTRSVLHP